MNRRPLVSIVTPSLNQARYIVQTIDSVRRQSYDNIEHIVVDGNSTDGTVDILAHFGRSASFRWLSEPDRGMYDAINKGFRLARGEILAYLNSDDLYPHWAVQCAVDFFVKHPEVGLVYGDYVQLDEADRQLLLLQPRYNALYVRRSGFIPQPTVFWRREVWDAMGEFDVTLQFVGDCDYWMKAGRRFGFVKLDEVLAFDRIQPGAKRSLGDLALRAELQRVRERYREEHDRRIPEVLLSAWVSVQRRLQLARFVLAVAQPRQRSRPWSATISGGSVRLRSLPLALAFLPGMAIRFLPDAIVFKVSASPRDAAPHIDRAEAP